MCTTGSLLISNCTVASNTSSYMTDALQGWLSSRFPPFRARMQAQRSMDGCPNPASTCWSDSSSQRTSLPFLPLLAPGFLPQA